MAGRTRVQISGEGTVFPGAEDVFMTIPIDIENVDTRDIVPAGPDIHLPREFRLRWRAAVEIGRQPAVRPRADDIDLAVIVGIDQPRQNQPIPAGADIGLSRDVISGEQAAL